MIVLESRIDSKTNGKYIKCEHHQSIRAEVHLQHEEILEYIKGTILTTQQVNNTMIYVHLF